MSGSIRLKQVIAQTEGSIIIAGPGGNLTEDNANLFWDNANNRLGIGTASPADTVQIGTSSGTFNINGNSGYGSTFTVRSHHTSGYVFDIENPDYSRLYLRGGQTDSAYVSSTAHVEIMTRIGTAAALVCWDYDGKLRNVFSGGTPGDTAALSTRVNISDTGSDSVFSWTDSISYIDINSPKGLGYAAPFIHMAAYSPLPTTYLGDVKISSYGNSWFKGGNLGIGINSPTSKLHVIGDGGNLDTSEIFHAENNAGTVSFKVQDNGYLYNSTYQDSHINLELVSLSDQSFAAAGLGLKNNLNKVGGIFIPGEWYGYGWYDQSAIISHLVVAAENDIVFTTSNTVPHAAFEKMRISTSGNVGIGINAPSYLLDVASTGHTRIAGGLLVGATETGGYITSGDHKMQILADNSTQGLMTFIGGSGLLQIWKDTSPTKAWGYGMAVPGNPIEDDLIFSRWTPGWTEAFRILNSTGYFGIGTSTPISALHIGAISGSADITIDGGGSARMIVVDTTPLGPGSSLTLGAGSGSGIGANGGDLILVAGNSGTAIGGGTYIRGGTGSSVGNIYIADTGGFCSIGGSLTTPVSSLHVYNVNGFNQFRMETPFTPTGNGDASGEPGDVSWDENYFYMKTATNGWGRVAWDFVF
jgi:hypothetical protein